MSSEQVQLFSSTIEHFSGMMLTLSKYFPEFLETVIWTFCVVGLTIISNSEPAIRSFAHFLSPVSGFEPQSISRTLHSALSASVAANAVIPKTINTAPPLMVAFMAQTATTLKLYRAKIHALILWDYGAPTFQSKVIA